MAPTRRGAMPVLCRKQSRKHLTDVIAQWRRLGKSEQPQIRTADRGRAAHDGLVEGSSPAGPTENSAVWRIPAERMKMRLEHLVPLSRQAVAVLRELRALSGGSANIFPSPGKGDCMSSNTMLYALYRMGYHGRATTHGFRAVASTILNETNLFNRDWIERQLHEPKTAPLLSRTCQAFQLLRIRAFCL